MINQVRKRPIGGIRVRKRPFRCRPFRYGLCSTTDLCKSKELQSDSPTFCFHGELRQTERSAGKHHRLSYVPFPRALLCRVPQMPYSIPAWQHTVSQRIIPNAAG
jgi:hypothetical protein